MCEEMMYMKVVLKDLNWWEKKKNECLLIFLLK